MPSNKRDFVDKDRDDCTLSEWLAMYSSPMPTKDRNVFELLLKGQGLRLRAYLSASKIEDFWINKKGD